jgi:hypothetical protein
VSSFPPRLIGRRDERVDLERSQEPHDALVEPLGWNGQHAIDQQRVLGMTQGSVGEQRPDRGEANVADSDAIVFARS